MKLSNTLINFAAAGMLILIFLLGLFSMKDDSVTMDELAHLPAGYSYLTQQDMRLNHEHPPLVKDLAALPLLFIRGIAFPSQTKAWQSDVNGQWDFGRAFLFQNANLTDKITLWGRLPMLFILLVSGFYLFKWTGELFGKKTALLALFLFAFSPTLLAHSRLVTTDVAAAAGVLISTYYFLKALKNPSLKNTGIAGVALGLAQLTKFSVVLLLPLFVFLAFIWARQNRSQVFSILKNTLLVFIIGFLVIGAVYQFHVWHYPSQKQITDSESLLENHPLRFPQKLIPAMARVSFLRPYAQYFLGLSSVFRRVTAGHTTYFLGEVSNAGWRHYFPVIYVIKEPLAFHLLTLLALLYSAWLLKKPFWEQPIRRISDWLKPHFAEFSLMAFILLYWLVSLSSTLNLGMRHLIPILPPTIILTSAAISRWLNSSLPLVKIKYLFLTGLLVWQGGTVLAVYPHFLAYFNEIVRGPANGYLYAVDSNLDWGQDLKRLKNWVEEKGIKTIYVDYFGGGDAPTELAEKYQPWWGQRRPEELPEGSYLAVSATFLQGGRGLPGSGFSGPSGFYQWLGQYQPLAKIGYSIFVYHIQ